MYRCARGRELLERDKYAEGSPLNTSDNSVTRFSRWLAILGTMETSKGLHEF